MLTAFIVFLVIVYLMPTIVGALLRVRGLGIIFVVNVFLGWTIAGWAVALMWVVQRIGDRPQPGARIDMRRDGQGRYVPG